MNGDASPSPAASDGKIVDDIFSAILNRYGEDVDSRTIPVPCGTVVLAFHTHGLMSNGGFPYLFAGNYNDDPGFIRTRDAFLAIGAAGATEAFRRAFACFPNSELPANIDERLELYTRNYSIQDAFDGKDTPDTLFWRSEDETMKCLVAFISRNAEHFPAR